MDSRPVQPSMTSFWSLGKPSNGKEESEPQLLSKLNSKSDV
ncbi:hypothetical protein MtrunA17_Chr3g0090411 [Medicago truncatula]|uniref:Uncharacterized protein n=1 Tax=Medicago truncatula TaxID=3880 RepID=A0A396ILG2_MEDTR|nr:hypothetical protein MtrunA17_Chr3g0090411 [Medicago truncatula]